MKTDKEKFVELMESFGLEVDGYYSSIDGEYQESISGYFGLVGFVFDEDGAFDRVYVEE